MASGETIGLLSFRRTFTLLILLVVLPSAGLSGFGVVAIVNERAAVEKRLEGVWSGRLSAVRADMLASLEAAQVEAVEPALRLSTGDLILTEGGFRLEGGEVVFAEPRLRALLEPLRKELSTAPERPVFFSMAGPQATLLATAVRRGDVVHGATLKPQAVEALLARAGARVTPSNEPARFVLVAVKREPAEGAVARFVSGMSEVREAFGPVELASLTLPAPFQDFRLVAHAVGEDPVAQASARNRTLYGVLLGVFYLTLALGVIFTGRTLYREARLSRLKTDFVSLVSHELRTPLTSIRMFIEMLAQGRVKEPQEIQTVLDMLSKETTRLSSMIENVLDWARIEQGHKTYQRERMPAKELAETALAAFRAQRVGHAVEAGLTVYIEEGLAPVAVDREALAGSLLNILQNAWKYSGAERKVSMRVVRDGRDIVFEVQDNGPGIPRREQRRIFERFYRVDNLLTRTTEGSGLGLAIAQRIVKAHGGRISVDSTVGSGSTFRIHLPAVTE